MKTNMTPWAVAVSLLLLATARASIALVENGLTAMHTEAYP